ncbi:hypothetical protein DFAR_30002 [Desulfarculales bacterium]
MAAQATAPLPVLEAADDGLFQAELNWELALELAGLVGVMALVGGRHLTRLLALAWQEAWAWEVVALLPLGLHLPDGAESSTWLARRELGSGGQGWVRRRLAQRNWPALASLGGAALALA